MFTIPLAEQKIKFAEKLTEIVWSMPRLDELLGHTRALGARHVGYGVRATDYLVLGDALLAALAAVLGDSFDAATREAWALAYNLVRGVGVRVGEALIPIRPASPSARGAPPASFPAAALPPSRSPDPADGMLAACSDGGPGWTDRDRNLATGSPAGVR